MDNCTGIISFLFCSLVCLSFLIFGAIISKSASNQLFYGLKPRPPPSITHPQFVAGWLQSWSLRIALSICDDGHSVKDGDLLSHSCN